MNRKRGNPTCRELDRPATRAAACSDGDARSQLGAVIGRLFETEAKGTLTALALSHKDAEAIQAILCGDSEKEAAARLGISRRAVHSRLEGLHVRFSVHSRTELVVKILASLLSA
mgnify:CR=1 FL=1